MKKGAKRSYFVTASLLALSICMPAFADDTWEDLKSNLQSGTNVTLTDNIIRTDGTTINVTGSPILDLTDKFIKGGGSGQGFTISNANSVFTIQGTDKQTAIISGFSHNSQGGLLNSVKNTTINIDNVTIESNMISGTEEINHLGGALKISGTANISNTIFKENTAIGKTGTDYEGSAGAIYAGTASNISITNTKFVKNEAQAVGAVGIFRQATLQDVIFEENKATSASGDGGGALFFGSVADATVNSVSNSSFKGNESASRGGAISTRAFAQGDNHAAKLDITNTTFTGNKADTNGGAIDNYFYNDSANSGAVKIANSIFGGENVGDGNTAKNGGAIYNHKGGSDDVVVKAGGEAQVGSINISDSTFTGNKANLGAGGAIYNEGILTVNDSTFTNNEANGVAYATDSTKYKKQGVGGAIATNGGITTINNSKFNGNNAVAGDDNKWSLGGAVSTMDNAVSTVNINNSTFSNNEAGVGGAVYNMLKTGNTINIDNSTFTGNTATYTGGAIANFATMNINNSNINDQEDGGGAIFLGAESITKINNTIFTGNESKTPGGAIATRTSAAGSNIGARLDITNSKFIGNTAATDGGAIDNYFMSSVSNPAAASIINTEFSQNSAKNGGAIYNHLTDIAGHEVSMTVENSQFTSNTANNHGGAIYNEGILTVGGTFTDNTANSYGGAIFNNGGNISILNSEFKNLKEIFDEAQRRKAAEINSLTNTNSELSKSSITKINTLQRQ